MGWSWLEEALDRQDEGENKQEANGKDLEAKIDEEKEDESESDIEDYELLPPDPMREGIDWVRDERGHILHPIEKRAHDALHALLDELKAAEHFPEEEDEQLADFVSGFMTLSAKLAGALGGVARGDDFFEPGMVVAWLKRILEILNKTIAAADATRVKDFLPRRSACLLSERAFCDPRRSVGINQGAAIALIRQGVALLWCPAYFPMKRS